MTGPPKSSFVNVLAWIFIALGAFSTVMALFQAVFIYALFPDGFHEAMVAKGGPRMPRYFVVFFEHIRLFMLGYLLVSVATLVSSIGLLKRWNWARLLFVVMMGFGILWNVVGSVFSFVFFTDMPRPPVTPNGFAVQFQVMTNVMLAFNVLVTIGFAVLFGWIIKRLLSAEIRSEFS